jgi:hypothetical protein
MANVIEIVRGISQAVSNIHDGATDENGDPVLIGLRREKEVPITDKRVMDGFSIRLHGDKLCLYYNSEITMQEVHSNGFENDIESIMADIVKHIKKEYKKVVGSSLELKKEGETDIHVQTMSRVRSWLTACQVFIVKSYEKAVDPIKGESKDSLEKKFKDWLRVDKEVGKGSKKNLADKRDEKDKKPPEGNILRRK